MERQSANDRLPANIHRGVALFSVGLGAAVSLGSVLWVGRHNSSVVLVLLFTVWVASPFAGLLLIYRAANRRSPARQRVTWSQMLVISLGSVVLYAADVFLYHPAKAAGPFLAVPVASWLFMVVWLSMSGYFHGEGGGKTTALNSDGKR
ncbi:MAG TPA: hypothetical protein VMQ56_14850 [Terracidiphilus sp.]|jgi:hypothetical protein|nr:hypothetical protein [Terracidiphilus sp.]